MPGGRRKNDPRQGTIDQDQEFKDFLESLTNPIPKPAAAEGDDQKEAKVTTTPLIEALREKKANKEKPREKAAKHGRGEPKEDTAEKAEKKILSKGAKDASAGSNEKGRRSTKAEKAAKEAVKVLTKEASAAKDSTPSQAPDKSAPATPTPERKRGNVSAAKAILQRDLGLSQASSRRRGAKRDATTATAAPATPAKMEEASTPKAKAKETAPAPSVPAPSEKTTPQSPKKNTRAERRAFKASLADKTNNRTVAEDSKPQAKTATPPAPTILKKPQAAPTPTAPKGPAAARAPPTEPAASRAAPQAQPKPEATNPRSQTPAQSSANAPSSGTGNRQAFLKHANPSQGITEPLIEEALKVFGAIEKVEIDKRKGFAYVDFVESAGLKKAIAGSPVKVAQGAVQVLERKEKVARTRPHPGPHGPPTGPARGRGGGFAGRGRGGRGGARGGHAAGADAPSGSPATAPAASAAPVADVAT
jgi:regulator of nonsense transcripts 3